jgi:hypothetical protein
MLNFVLQPWQVPLVILACWVNQQQQQVIEYLRCENQVLREKVGKRRILLNDAQRRRLAVKGKVIGRNLLAEIELLPSKPPSSFNCQRTSGEVQFFDSTGS